MKSFAFESWDDGRLIINAQFAGALRACEMATFDAWMNYTGGDVAKDVLAERTTTRVTLEAADGESAAFYIKRHRRPPLKEYVKPLLRLRRPILGARPEWEAILAFHAAGIPTMTPVALGEQGNASFLVTQAIEGCRKLSHVLRELDEADSHTGRRLRLDMIEHAAHVARTMHTAGMHHQDFYLHHMLVPEDSTVRDESAHESPLYVIDLGRVVQRARVGSRWIVKDLAQLDYSARFLSRADRLRFFKSYWNGGAPKSERRWLTRIARKVGRITRHSRRNKL